MSELAKRNCSRSVLEHLPAELDTLGRELLADLFSEYKRRLLFEKAKLHGNLLCVAHLFTDDTLIQLRREGREDYGLRRWVNESTTDLIVE